MLLSSSAALESSLAMLYLLTAGQLLVQCFTCMPNTRVACQHPFPHKLHCALLRRHIP